MKSIAADAVSRPHGRKKKKMEGDKLVCGVCRFSVFLADEEGWWYPCLRVKVDPDQRPHDCPRTGLEGQNGNAERDA